MQQRIGNLSNMTLYEVTMTAATRSLLYPDTLLESPPAPPHSIFISQDCPRDQEMSHMASTGLNMLLVGVIMVVIIFIILTAGLTLVCRMKNNNDGDHVIKPSFTRLFEEVERVRGGWRGEISSDIPATLFSKHVEVRSETFYEVVKTLLTGTPLLG